MDVNKYLFRRQFILGSKFVNKLNNWKKEKIGEKLFLNVHPDLELTKVNNNDDFIILLGFMLDPYNPSFDNVQIIQKMIENVTKADDIFDLVSPMGGRFVIIANVNEDLRVFSDPAGFRHVYYHKDSSENIWCSSESAILAEIFELPEDEDVKKDLFQLPLFRDTTEFWIPGNISLYQKIYHLTPNHYLDLNNGDIIRYWPGKKLKPISLEECVAESSLMLRGLMESASIRFDMSLAITAGLDTRILLAASKKVIDQIYFFTHTHENLDTEGPDIAIPREILNKIGVKHHIVYRPEKMSKEFERLYSRNVSLPRGGKGLNAYGFDNYFKEIGREMLVTNGVCSEIARNFYPLPESFKVTGKALATLVTMSGSKTAEIVFDEWLTSARKVTHFGVRILELFYWENRNAKWPPYNDYDIAIESYSPFNCRALLEKMISVDRKYRLPPDFKLHKELVNYMCPELLQFPINPPINNIEKIRNILDGTKFYDMLRLLKFYYNYYSKQ